MDRVAVLAALDRRMLEAFSRRTTDALRKTLPLRVALPHLEPFLALNVAKEVRKDALVIRRAGEALSAGAPPGAEVAHRLLQAAKDIDRDFLRELGGFPVRIEIPYARIDPLRLLRMERVLGVAYRVLEAWRRGRKLRNAFPRGELEDAVLDLFELYARETGALSHAVRLPRLLAPLRERLAQGLLDAMSGAGRALARDISAAVYRKR